MEPDSREDGQEISGMETFVLIQGRWSHFNQKHYYLTYPLIFYLFFLYLLLWLTKLRNFSGIFYGVALVMNLNFIWLNGLLFVPPFLRVA